MAWVLVLIAVAGCGGSTSPAAEQAEADIASASGDAPGGSAATDVPIGSPDDEGRLGVALEGIYVERAALVEQLAHGSVRIESPSSCESVRNQLLGGDGVLIADFAPVAIDFGPLGSTTDPGGFTMQIDSRLVYVTLAEPADVVGCTARIVPGLALDSPLPTSIAPVAASAWSVATSCTRSLDESVTVTAYLVSSDGGGAQVGFKVAGTGASRTATDVSAVSGRGPAGFIAAHRAMMSAAFAGGELSEDTDISSLTPDGAVLGELPLPGSATVLIEDGTQGFAGSMEAGDLVFRFACAE
ncbi:MAG: hypothetical protein EBU70_03075 [Actinobacteria bacterium]|nr:hypothetical protein [Actinomycetota bacterium]